MLPPRIFLAREFPYLPIGAMGQLLVVDFHYTFRSEFDTHEGHDVHRTAEEAYTTVDMTAAQRTHATHARLKSFGTGHRTK